MTALVWDAPGTHFYENGLDRGVLYLPDGKAIPWNGLTNITEKFKKSVSPVYFDGQKVSDIVTLGDFSASLKAITYPDEFLQFEGLLQMGDGVYLGDQMIPKFALSWRTLVSNDTTAGEVGYKLHVLYNVTAIPSEKNFNTLTQDPQFAQFQWELTAVPEEVPGFRPTAHIVIDSRRVDPQLLIEVEKILYGGTTANPKLIPFEDLVTLIREFFRVEIIDNRDGTWTAYSEYDGYIVIGPDGTSFTINGVDAVYITPDLYKVSSS